MDDDADDDLNVYDDDIDVDGDMDVYESWVMSHDDDIDVDGDMDVYDDNVDGEKGS